MPGTGRAVGNHFQAGRLGSLVGMTPSGQPPPGMFLGHITDFPAPPSPAPPHQRALRCLRPPTYDASSASIAAAPATAPATDAIPAGPPAGPRARPAPKASAPRVPSQHAALRGAHQSVSPASCTPTAPLLPCPQRLGPEPGLRRVQGPWTWGRGLHKGLILTQWLF